jgi:hypothetical protein
MSEEAENILEEFIDDSAPDEVEKAKTMGWKEPKEWKGNPPKNGFVKAKEYLERAETVIPIMRAENKKLKDELNDARADLKSFKEETNKTVAKMAQMSKVALDRQRTQLEDKYSAAIDAATEVGDKEQVRKLRRPSAKTSRSSTKPPRSRRENGGGQEGRQRRAAEGRPGHDRRMDR